MKISIIVPAYNTEKYIQRCVDSILDRTFRDNRSHIRDHKRLCSGQHPVYQKAKWRRGIRKKCGAAGISS